MAWRPSTPYHGWRLAAIVVLAVTAVAWFLWPDVSGYIGGAAWFLLLFLPAIALRKITQLAAQGDYESAAKTWCGSPNFASHRRTARASPVISPFEISALHIRRAFSSVSRRSRYRLTSTRRSQLRSAPAVLVLILVNALVFLFEILLGAGTIQKFCIGLERSSRTRLLRKANTGGCSLRFFYMAAFCISRSIFSPFIFLVRRWSAPLARSDFSRAI